MHQQYRDRKSCTQKENTLKHVSDKSIVARLRVYMLFGLSLSVFVTQANPHFQIFVDKANVLYGEKAANTVARWLTLFQDIDQADAIKLQRVNTFFNTNIQFISDSEAWGHEDYWATPMQTMGMQSGDCEDFSIAKYITLIKLGVSPEKLRLTYVKAQLASRAQAHMVLAYYASEQSEPLILDNIVPSILPASQRSDLTPVYSFNATGLWLGTSSKNLSQRPETRLSQWLHVLNRMQEEGFN